MMSLPAPAESVHAPLVPAYHGAAEELVHEDPIAPADFHAAAPGVASDDAGVDPAAEEESATTEPPPKKRQRKAPLSAHEALTLFAHKGIYVDEATGELRTSTNHKRCDKWDMYGYTRHFTFKCYKKYESERLDDAELARLMEAKAAYFRAHPVVPDEAGHGDSSSLLRRHRRIAKGERILTPEELRVQERHWMDMWKDAKAELRALREEIKGEDDGEVRAELVEDIAGLKRRKEDWARLLGLREAVQDLTSVI